MYTFFKNNKIKNLITTIDVGSSKITCLIGEKSKSKNAYKIIGNSQNICKGFKQGNVTDILELSDSIGNAISSAEKMAGTSISRVNVVLNGGKQFSRKFKAETKIVNGEITDNEIQKIMSSCIHDATTHNFKLLHAIPIRFQIDNSISISNLASN